MIPLPPPRRAYIHLVLSCPSLNGHMERLLRLTRTSWRTGRLHGVAVRNGCTSRTLELAAALTASSPSAVPSVEDLRTRLKGQRATADNGGLPLRRAFAMLKMFMDAVLHLVRGTLATLRHGDWASR